MNKKLKYGLIAICQNLISLLIYLPIIYVGCTDQYINFKTLKVFTGKIIESGIITNGHKKNVFYLTISGLNETLEIYRMTGKYEDLNDMLQPNDVITVCYRPHSASNVNIDLVQIEKNKRVVLSVDEYKKKQSSLIYIGIFGILITLVYSIDYYWEKTK